MSAQDIIADAVGRALKTRRLLQVSLTNPLCSLDAAERMGIEVRVIDLPSMEGIYVAGQRPKIVLSSLRPLGRRRFTCAHEIGHHVFGHGDQFDELISEKKGDRKKDIKEMAADTFAAYFLMPKTLIDSGMRVRSFAYGSLDPQQVYGLSSWLGVGYRTLVSHLFFGLRLITRSQANALSRIEPIKIRHQLLGSNVSGHLHVVDQHWIGRAVDCEVDDYLLLPKHIHSNGASLVLNSRCAISQIVRVASPGIAQLTDCKSGWSVYVRSSKRNYVGRSCFRFEEEID
jgi:hypothetical protein